MQSLNTPPPWRVSEWLNTPAPLSLEGFRDKVVLVEVFQMLCPGCVSHGLPQAVRVRNLFSTDDVAVIGLHSVFEHHDAMQPVSLRAFLHEYRIAFPVGVDEADPTSDIPRTMAAYGLRGTPSTLLFDRAGALRHSWFGQVDDLVLGASIAMLLGAAPFQTKPDAQPVRDDACGPYGCNIP